jgi:putative Mg2+ transporter-C (MgtC) family protein
MLFLLRLVAASLLGSLIGLERQWHQRTAGLRTNALVATGAAAFAGVALSAAANGNAGPILGQIITGIGFLGAGVIFKEGFNVRGLNTAATIWCSAAVGTLAGLGMLEEAGVTTVMVVGINLVLRRVAAHFTQAQPDASSEMESVYRLHGVCSRRSLAAQRSLLLQEAVAAQVLVRQLHSENAPSNLSRFSADLVVAGRNDHVIETVVNRLSLDPGMRSMRWEIVSSATRFE